MGFFDWVASEADAIVGDIHGSFSSGPGARASSRVVESIPGCCAGTVLCLLVLCLDDDDEPFSGIHCDIVDGAGPAGVSSLATGILTCGPWGGTADDTATGVVEVENCSGASEKASVVDARD